MANSDTQKTAVDQNRESYADDAKARRVLITGSDGTIAEVNSEGRLDVVEHAHVSNGFIHFEKDMSASEDLILIDISDTTNYPHIDTSYIHLENIRIHTDSSASADYTLEIGFLDDVDADNGNFYSLIDVDGTKTTGQRKEIFLNLYPNGPRCQTSSIATSEKSLNDTAFQTDVNLASTLDPGTTDTPSGDGDFVLRVTVNAGTVIVGVELSYHTH
jgi:hypothetical protein